MGTADPTAADMDLTVTCRREVVASQLTFVQTFLLLPLLPRQPEPFSFCMKLLPWQEGEGEEKGIVDNLTMLR